MSLSITIKSPSALNARDQAAELAAAVTNAVDNMPDMWAEQVTTSSVQLQPVYTVDREGNQLQDGFSFVQKMQVGGQLLGLHIDARCTLACKAAHAWQARG